MAKRREKTSPARFKKIEMLADFTDPEVESIRRIAKEVRVPAGEVIMQGG